MLCKSLQAIISCYFTKYILIFEIIKAETANENKFRQMFSTPILL